MQKYKIYWGAVVMIVGAAMLAYALLGQARFYPFVRVQLPDQGVLVFVDAPWTDMAHCQKAQKLMIGAVQTNCPSCKLEMSCPTVLPAQYLLALQGKAIESYVVQSGSLRIAIESPAGQREVCEAMTAQISREYKLPATCLAAIAK